MKYEDGLRWIERYGGEIIARGELEYLLGSALPYEVDGCQCGAGLGELQIVSYVELSSAKPKLAKRATRSPFAGLVPCHVPYSALAHCLLCSQSKPVMREVEAVASAMREAMARAEMAEYQENLTKAKRVLKEVLPAEEYEAIEQEYGAIEPVEANGDFLFEL